MRISATCSSVSRSAPRWWCRADASLGPSGIVRVARVYPSSATIVQVGCSRLEATRPGPTAQEYGKPHRCAAFLLALKNPRRCPCSPSRHSGSVPGPSGPETPWLQAWRLLRLLFSALRPPRARALPPATTAFVLFPMQPQQTVKDRQTSQIFPAPALPRAMDGFGIEMILQG